MVLQRGHSCILYCTLSTIFGHSIWVGGQQVILPMLFISLVLCINGTRAGFSLCPDCLIVWLKLSFFYGLQMISSSAAQMCCWLKIYMWTKLNLNPYLHDWTSVSMETFWEEADDSESSCWTPVMPASSKRTRGPMWSRAGVFLCLFHYCKMKFFGFPAW